MVWLVAILRSDALKAWEGISYGTTEGKMLVPIVLSIFLFS
jgi:hypothetical protein